MGGHARVAFILDEAPWELERELIRREVLPLNIADNAHSSHYLALRGEHKRRARELPVTS